MCAYEYMNVKMINLNLMHAPTINNGCKVSFDKQNRLL